MRVAVLADVFGNLPALRAVLDDIDSQDVDRIVSLGNSIGYGPHPRECFDLLRDRADVFLLGPWERWLIGRRRPFGPRLAAPPRRLLGSVRRSLRRGSSGWGRFFGRGLDSAGGRFLRSCPDRGQSGGFTLVHRAPLRASSEERLGFLFEAGPRCVHADGGHAGVWVRPDLRWIDALDLDDRRSFSDSEMVVVDVGSVGRSVPDRSQACYAVLDTDADSVTWRRPDYDPVASGLRPIPPVWRPGAGGDPDRSPGAGTRLALIGSVCSNLEALDAVLLDIDRRGIDEVMVLGDTVATGGPDPVECLQRVRERASSLTLGDDEQAIVCHATSWGAHRARWWNGTREWLAETGDGLRFIERLPSQMCRGRYRILHGSPRQPVREFLLPADAGDRAKMTEVFEGLEEGEVCFFAHTHIAGAFVDGGRRWAYASQLGGVLDLRGDRGKHLVGVGSVGQPRDGDPRACYVTVEDDVVRWHRVEYDVQTTVEKICRIEDLPDYLAQRLLEGR